MIIIDLSVISHSHIQFTVACEKVTFSALSLSRLSASLLRSIQHYDIATRAKESKNKETAPALANITTLLASSCCLFVWIYLQCHMTISVPVL